MQLTWERAEELLPGMTADINSYLEANFTRAREAALAGIRDLLNKPEVGDWFRGKTSPLAQVQRAYDELIQYARLATQTASRSHRCAGKVDSAFATVTRRPLLLTHSGIAASRGLAFAPRRSVDTIHPARALWRWRPSRRRYIEGDDGKVLGIVSERDLMRAIGQAGGSKVFSGGQCQARDALIFEEFRGFQASQ